MPYLGKVENSNFSFIHSIAHDWDISNSVSHIIDNLSIKMNNYWYFSFTNNDDTSIVGEASNILDVDTAYHSGATEIF